MKKFDYSEADKVAKAIDDTIVAYRPFTDVVAAAIRAGESPVQRGLLILGESRIGKSTTAEVVCRELNARAPAGELSALSIEIPASPTEKTIAKALVMKIGQINLRASEQDLANRFVTLAKACNLKLVIIDEFHHFVEGRRGLINLVRAANSLKGLMNRTKVSFVLMGLPKTLRIMNECQQLRGRFASCKRLRQLGADVLDDCPDKTIFDQSYKEYLNVLRALTKVLPFSNAEIIYTTDLGRRLLSASDGRLGYIKPLLIGAVELAHERGETQLSVELMEAAFTRYIWDDGVGGKNPFNRKFRWDDRLNQAGEPFAPDGEW